MGGSLFIKIDLQDESKREFSEELRSILEVSAVTGLYWHNWDELRTLLLFRLKQSSRALGILGFGESIQVLQDYYKLHIDVAVGPPRPLVTGERYQELEDRLTAGLKSFTDGAPFTLQRLCEVLLNPQDRYPNLDKVALAFEKLLLVTSTFPPSPGPYPGIPSVTVPMPTPVQAKDVDPKPAESPSRENDDTNSNVTSKSNDGSVETDLTNVASASVAADEEMADIASTESKEESMEVDGPQPSGAIAAEEDAKENPSEISASKDEWQLVDAADITGAAAPTETTERSPMLDRSESEGGFAASRL